MSDLTVSVAAPDVADLKTFVETNAGGTTLSTKIQSPYRDFAVMEILLTAATSATVKVVFDLLKEYIRSRFLRTTGKSVSQSIAIKVGEVSVTIDKDTDPDRLDKILAIVLKASQEAVSK